MKRRIFGTSLILLGLMLTVFVTVRAEGDKTVLVLTSEGPVSPVMLSYLERGLEAAEEDQVEAIILQLDTPGGQVELTREIVKAIVNANVPIVVYVAPSGAFAASAGTFITLAGHAAAMAPQTSIGAASPVDGQGGDIGETLKAKVENMLLADMENLADRRGEEAVEWAKKAITEAEAASANQALEIGAIDFIANDIDDLLSQLDGFPVEIRGETRNLQTAGATARPFEMTVAERILSTFLRPEIAFILISIGSLAIIYELASPGGFVSGVIGVICLLLAFYALGQLPINYAGLGLIVLAFILFAAEIVTPTHGALTISGVVALALGGLLLFDTAEFNYRVSVVPIVGFSLAIGAIFFFIIGKAIQAMRDLPKAGVESLIGMTGVAKSALSPSGTVFVDGSRWQATLADGTPDQIEEGDEVEVTARDGFKLTVKKR